MNADLVKQIRDAGFSLKEAPQRNQTEYDKNRILPRGTILFDYVLYQEPSLLDLMEAVKAKSPDLVLHTESDYRAEARGYSATGETPKEAFARLWLAMQHL